MTRASIKEARAGSWGSAQLFAQLGCPRFDRGEQINILDTDHTCSHPSFSSLRLSIATAFALASRSGSDCISETRQRKTL